MRFSILALSLLISCSIKWTEAIKRGQVTTQPFRQQIQVEVSNGLLIMPVRLKGKDYRFLFDSGAPTSISKELQREMQFKVISSGHIVDSDNNRQEVSYVSIDALQLGEVLFKDHTAFVGDFKANYKIGCLELDGIIGSNLQRSCNWTIDYQNKSITLFNGQATTNTETDTVSFKTDFQYNLLVSLEIGPSTVRNMTVDYGSNGPLALPEDVFNFLEREAIIGETFLQTGQKQTGIIGKRIDIENRITYVDAIGQGNFKTREVEIVTGSAGLVGSKILSRYLVTIDWSNSNLYFNEVSGADLDLETYGVRLGLMNDRNIYIESITEGSDAHRQGLKPDMMVHKIGSIDFTNGDDYCDFVHFISNPPDRMMIEVVENNESRQVSLEKKKLAL